MQPAQMVDSNYGLFYADPNFMNTYNPIQDNSVGLNAIDSNSDNSFMNEVFYDLKRPKKRKRKSNVHLPEAEKLENVKSFEDALLSLDSISFDEYIKKTMNSRSLPEEEIELVKDIKRRIKNRESARKSRNIKRSKLDNLEGKVKELKEENTSLKNEVSYLRQYNSQLQMEVIKLNNISYTTTPIKEEVDSSHKGITTQSIVLFVVLFSFGLLWNLDTNTFISSIGGYKSNRENFNVFPTVDEDLELSKLFDDYGVNDEEIIKNFRKMERTQPRLKDVEKCC